jgi:hypothetical protein
VIIEVLKDRCLGNDEVVPLASINNREIGKKISDNTVLEIHVWRR